MRYQLRSSKLPKGVVRDAQGFPCDEAHENRLTACCFATVTFSDDVLCCKGCWREVDSEYMEPPVPCKPKEDKN